MCVTLCVLRMSVLIPGHCICSSLFPHFDDVIIIIKNSSGDILIDVLEMTGENQKFLLHKL